MPEKRSLFNRNVCFKDSFLQLELNSNKTNQPFTLPRSYSGKTRETKRVKQETYSTCTFILSSTVGVQKETGCQDKK